MFESKLYILVAYPYFNQEIFDILKGQPKDKYHLIVDSGAFTAWNTGKTILLDEYCKFLDSIECLQPFKSIQLDVFGDPEQSWKNYLIMKNRGYDTMPVFTRGENQETLEKMYQETDYIMFGGVVTGAGNKGYVKWFCENNKGRDCHWLGFVNMPFIKHYKPYSVDSSSWTSSVRYGSLQLVKADGTMMSLSNKDFAKRPSKKVLQLMYKLGLTDAQISMLRFEESWRGHFRHDKIPKFSSTPVRGLNQVINAMSHIKRSFDVRRNLGTKIYLAVAVCSGLRALIIAHDHMKERNII